MSTERFVGILDGARTNWTRVSLKGDGARDAGVGVTARSKQDSFFVDQANDACLGLVFSGAQFDVISFLGL